MARFVGTIQGGDDMAMIYSSPKQANEAGALPDVEVFYDDADEVNGHARNFDGDGEPVQAGWYWWSCFPGCLPDGEPNGPFATEQEAIDDAQADADQFDESPESEGEEEQIDDVPGEERS